MVASTTTSRTTATIRPDQDIVREMVHLIHNNEYATWDDAVAINDRGWHIRQPVAGGNYDRVVTKHLRLTELHQAWRSAAYIVAKHSSHN